MSPGPFAPERPRRSSTIASSSAFLVVGLARRRRHRRRRAADSGSRPDTCVPRPRSPAPALAALPKCCAKRSASSVADVMISLSSGRAREQLLQVAEQEVDVEAALVRLVDDDRVVVAKRTVALRFREQDAVGHELHVRVRARLVGEADLVADRLAQRRPELLGDARRRRRARRCAAAAYGRSGRARRVRPRARSSAAAWSCPSRSRR